VPVFGRAPQFNNHRQPARTSEHRPYQTDLPPRPPHGAASRSGPVSQALSGKRGSSVVRRRRRDGPHPLAQPSLLMGERRDVGLGVGELRRPEQRVVRAGLHAEPAVHARREVDREAVRDVAHPLPPAPRRAANGIRAGTGSVVTAPRCSRPRRRTGPACAELSPRHSPGDVGTEFVPRRRAGDAGAVLVPRNGLLVRLDVDAPVRAPPSAQHACRAVPPQQRAPAPAAGRRAPPRGRPARHAAPPPPGTPGGARRRARGTLRSPGSFAPGHSFAALAAGTKSLRSGCPATPPGSSNGAGCGWPSKTTPNISYVSRSCHAAPR